MSIFSNYNRASLSLLIVFILSIIGTVSNAQSMENKSNDTTNPDRYMQISYSAFPASKNGFGHMVSFAYKWVGLQVGFDKTADSRPQLFSGTIPHSDFTYVPFRNAEIYVEGMFIAPVIADRIRLYGTIGMYSSGGLTEYIQSNATGWYYEGNKREIDATYYLTYGIGTRYLIPINRLGGFLIGVEYNSIRKLGATLGVMVPI